MRSRVRTPPQQQSMDSLFTDPAKPQHRPPSPSLLHPRSRYVIFILILSTSTLVIYIIKVSGRLFYFIVTIEVSDPTFKTFIVTIEVSDPILRHSFSSLYLMYLIRLSKFSRYVRWWGRREERGARAQIYIYIYIYIQSTLRLRIHWYFWPFCKLELVRILN